MSTPHKHEFTNEDGMHVDLTDITYEVLQTYVDTETTDSDVICFTHIVRVRPESIDINLQVRYPNDG